MTHKLYLPINSNGQNRRRGIGIPPEHFSPADLAALGVGWWYDWEWQRAGKPTGPAEYVSMSWSGVPIANQEGDILVFNEPDNREQANLTPGDAARRYRLLTTFYRPEQMIVGGWTFWRGYTWAIDFIAELRKLGIPAPTRWHVHGYTEWGIRASQVIEFWENCHRLTEGTYWVTEFGSPEGDRESFQELQTWLEACPWVERYAAFASRVTGREGWYPTAWPQPARMALIHQGGELTELGRLYRGE